VHFSGIASDGHGHIYAADENDRIFKLSSAGHVLSVWGSTGTGPGQFRQPWGIAVGPGGNILVADGQNHRVEIFSPAEKVLGQWQLYPQIHYPGGPCGLLYLAVAHTGTSYVVDDCYNRVLKLSPSGQILQRRPWRGTGRDRYSEVSGVAVGARGTVVVTGTFRIERFSPNGSVLGVIREPGFPGYAFCPAGIAVDGHGDLYVADPENYRVFKLSSSGRTLGLRCLRRAGCRGGYAGRA
jgi:DNA-binding beta-propeller fold protein YncE